MISEIQQEQAVLYALGLLDADEADDFERQMDADAGLRSLAHDCQEASAALALAAPATNKPPADLKRRIMEGLNAGNAPTVVMATANQGAAGRAASALVAWVLPWVATGTLAVFCYLLTLREGRLNGENTALKGTLALQRHTRPVDPLAGITLCHLDAATGAAPGQPSATATVAWDPDQRVGLLQIIQLTPPASGKDYQLWAVEEGRPGTVNAGLVRVDERGSARVVFKPADDEGGGRGRVVAFALSLERAGGSPTNAGPIVMIGKF